MESVVSCCDNSRSCHEGLAKHLTLSLRAQLSGRKRGVGICRQGIQPLLQKTKWKAQLCKNGPPDPTVALPFLPSAVSNISTEEQCQYLDLEEPET